MAYSKKKAPPKRVTTAATVEEDIQDREQQDKLALIRERWDHVSEVWGPQLERETADLRFQVPENQWTDAALMERRGNPSQGIAPRPTLSITQIDQPRKLVINQFRAAKLGINVHPVSEQADDDTAQAIQGLIRHIERDSRAEIAYTWAFKRALDVGRGWLRILTEYDPQGGHPSDQKILIRRILRQECVYPDPAAELPDFSDGKYLFFVSWMHREDYKQKYPRAKFRPNTSLEWEDLSSQAPAWVRDGKDVLVVEYWYKRYHYASVPGGGEREVWTVHRCVASGWEILEEADWPGRYIPFIPAIGDELIPFDDEHRWVGMIGPAKDGQQLYNVAASTLVERMLLEPKAPYVGYTEQFQGLEQYWNNANRRNYPYLPVNLVRDGQNNPLPLPQRSQLDMTGMSIAAMVLQEAQRFIQSTTAVYDPSLGRETSRDKSGKAIQALQEQANAGTSQFAQNFADVTMTYVAIVLLDLIPHYYNRPGRAARILRGDDDKSELVLLNRPFVAQNGRPRLARAGEQNAKTYDLTRLLDGGYIVSVNIGKSFQTRLEQGSAFMADIMQAMPEYLPLLGDLFFRFRDDPGAKEIAERLAKVREQKYPGLGEGEDGNMSPEQAQAQLAGMKQRMEAMGQEMQAMAQALQIDQAKQQASMAKVQADVGVKMAELQAEAAVKQAEIASKERIAAANNETKLAIEGMNQRFEALQALLLRSHETARQHEQMAHEVAKEGMAAHTVTYSREKGRQDGQENERSEEGGSSDESGFQEQPPPNGGAGE